VREELKRKRRVGRIKENEGVDSSEEIKELDR